MTNAINRKSAAMPAHAKGIALTFRFRRAYTGEKVHHVAVASMWRDQNDELQAAVLHQESIPVLRDGRIAGFKGLVFDHFDTGEHFADGRAPVETSMRKHGLPDVRITFCPRPERLPELYEVMKDATHPYAAFARKGAEGEPGLTCFSITEAAHHAMQGDEARVDASPTLPLLARRSFRQGIVPATDYDKLRHFPYKGHTLDSEAPDLDEKQLTAGFIHFGSHWGSHEEAPVQWDVKGSVPPARL